MALQGTGNRSERVVNQFLNWVVCARRIAAGLAILVGAGFITAGLFGAAQPATAQQGFGNFFGYQTQSSSKRRKTRRARRAAPSGEAKNDKQEKEQAKTSGAVYAVISVGDQSMSVYDGTGRIAQTSVSTGMRGHRTPTGVFSVIGRRRHHYSNLYGGAPMPWMQRITWSGVAMHAGHVPGYPASHGCIRLPYSFAPKMWRLTELGSRVIVAPRNTIPEPISHPLLPKPTMQPAPDESHQASRAEPVAQVELASMSAPAHIPMTTAATSADAPMGEGTAAGRLLDPIAYAAALKERAKSDKVAAEKAEKTALKAAQDAGEEARQAVEDVQKAKVALGVAQARVAKLEADAAAANGKAQDDAASAAALETAQITARSVLARARGALDEAQRREAIKTPAAFSAVERWKAAVATTKAAQATLLEADRRTEPVSVFVSKKEGRVFIRQDWKEVYEAPVTIRDPERPLGTHVYIAVDAEPDGAAMRWTAITVPTNSDDKKSAKASKKDVLVLPVQKTKAVAVADVAQPLPTPAAEALDRIELPPGVRERISELLWTGASLIVSDNGRSGEMSKYTDFIVLTR